MIRLAAVGGVIGPTAFIASWSIGAAITHDSYSSVEDAISRLAAVRADSRTVMTSGMVTFGVGLPLYAIALRRLVSGPAWVAAAATGIATLAVASAPLDNSSSMDRWHGVFATAGYISLVATPLLAARHLSRAGHGGLATMAAVAGFSSTALLCATATDGPTGLFQRLGLSATHLWVIVSAIGIAAGSLQPEAERRVRKAVSSRQR